LSALGVDGVDIDVVAIRSLSRYRRSFVVRDKRAACARRRRSAHQLAAGTRGSASAGPTSDSLSATRKLALLFAHLGHDTMKRRAARESLAHLLWREALRVGQLRAWHRPSRLSLKSSATNTP
jgi:hypothetical protein